MPTPVPTPAPAQNPVATWRYAGGSTSGTHEISGLGCATGFSDDWYIRTQSLFIQYIRIPFFGSPAGVTNLGLSGTPTVNYVIPQTRLMAKATATVSRVKEFGTCYDTSTWFQPQKFVFLGASADHNGSAYGPYTDFTTSTLGPAGDIATYQEAYFRRSASATDTYGTDTVTVYNTRNYEMDCNGITFLSTENEQWNGSEDFFIWLGPKSHDKYSCVDLPWKDYDKNFINSSPNYSLPGQYAYSKESFYGAVNFVDGIGQALQTQKLFPDLPTGPANYGLPEYDPSLHDWN